MVPDEHIVWHLGQVVAQFRDEARPQWIKVKESLAAISRFPGRAPRLRTCPCGPRCSGNQGSKTFDDALGQLYQLEEQGRPLSEGIIGDDVKGSLNVLEGLWEALSRDDKAQVREMVRALCDLHTDANKVAIVVALPCEAKAIREAFGQDRDVTIEGDTPFFVRHPDYRVVVRESKGLIATTDQVKELLEQDKPKWVIMCGIAGSLGTAKRGTDSQSDTFVGPDVEMLFSPPPLPPTASGIKSGVARLKTPVSRLTVRPGTS